ncbi:hypothetical protein M0E87_11665 [Corynebacterium sp. CCM 9185]|uniref:hypothetical protein n=1 Tax=Corynebacterium marambiense TaxID=2765364 RepID=UPI002002C940|nr:hypothetical protein [Corynebacterium marambiense]MCK7664306.1 hypothetical protein [Corynebacterium marambiense]MCX7543119.1 hypothetical protein [Corynebacterium marambiense]
MDNRNRRLPREIYIRRRVAAGVVLIIVVFLVGWLIVALAGGDNPQPTAAEGSETTTSTQVTPASGTSRASTTSAADGDGSMSGTTARRPADESERDKPYASSEASAAMTTESPSPEPKTTCALSDLIVTATSDQVAYAPDVQPRFYMTVTNPTAADCVIDLGKDVLRFEVYDLATNRRVWSDVDCNPAVDVTERTFPAGEERYYEAVWSRTNSAPGSCAARAQVPAGGYYLHTLVGDNHSDAHPFNLM